MLKVITERLVTLILLLFCSYPACSFILTQVITGTVIDIYLTAVSIETRDTVTAVIINAVLLYNASTLAI